MIVEYQVKHKGKTIKCVDFDGLNDQLKYILPNIKNNTFDIVNEIKNKVGWNGSYTLDETINGMKYGFDKQTEYFLDLIDQLRVQEGEGEGIFLDTEGYIYDMGSVVSGVPECCLNYHMSEPKPLIKIYVDVSFHCGFTPEQLNNRCTAIANLINTLLLNGVIVELYYFMYNIQSDMDCLITLNVDVNVLPISIIAFLSSVDYFRKIMFITMDCVRGKESECGRGYSQACDFMINKFKKEGIFFIGAGYTDDNMHKHLNSVIEANNYLLDSFKLFCKENKIRVNFLKQ